MRFPRVAGVAGFLLVSLAPISARGESINPLTADFTGFTTNPTAFNTAFGIEGPDGLLGTLDDLVPGGFGINSGYTGGLYTGPANVPLTVDISMTSTVIPLGGGSFFYTWTITNTGTGPLIQYFDTGNGPNFLQNPPLFGTAGVDRTPGTADDVAPQSETDNRVGGPPAVGQWGGQWNPETPTLAERLEPTEDQRLVPEASIWITLLTGIAVVIGLKVRQARRYKQRPNAALLKNTP